MGQCQGCGAQVEAGAAVCARCRTLLSDDSGFFPPAKENRDALAALALSDPALKRLRRGRALLGVAIAATLFFAALGWKPGLLEALLLMAVYLPIAIAGAWLVMRGLDYDIRYAIGLCYLMIVPLVSLVLMIGLCIAATRELARLTR